jgi:Putative Actinobacterial Holin-X, holin superfamily III
MDEQPKYTSLPEAFSRVMTDLADLIRKEMRLARAELSTKLSIGIRAGIWMLAAAFFAIVAALLVVQACVLALATTTGLALHWSSLIVAAALGILAAAAFAKSKTDAPEQLTPDRAINQVKRDIKVARSSLHERAIKPARQWGRADPQYH